jgi:hypothetical protein
MVRLICFAVLRPITNSNFIGRSNDGFYIHTGLCLLRFIAGCPECFFLLGAWEWEFDEIATVLCFVPVTLLMRVGSLTAG